VGGAEQDAVIRRVALVAALAAVLSPVTGAVLIWLVARPSQRVSAVEQIDAIVLYILYSLFYAALPAALFAAAGALVMLALIARGLSRSGLLSVGAVLGAVAGLVVVPPLGYHLFDLVEIVRNGPRGRPYTVVAVINGAMWGLVIAGYALRSSLRSRGAGTGAGPGGHAMIQLALVVVLFLASSGTASAERACLPLRTFTPEERQRFETQHGMDWWKVMGLIPGPAQPGDWVERPWGDSTRTAYMPQKFWDPRSCVGPKTK
jgi:hypothetical protein